MDRTTFNEDTHGNKLGLDPRLLSTQTHVYIETQTLSIYAYLHHPKDKRLSEYLTENPTFINLTQAQILPLDGRETYGAEHLGLRTSQIVVWMEVAVSADNPVEALESVQRSDEGQSLRLHHEAKQAAPVYGKDGTLVADPFAG